MTNTSELTAAEAFAEAAQALDLDVEAGDVDDGRTGRRAGPSSTSRGSRTRSSSAGSRSARRRSGVASAPTRRSTRSPTRRASARSWTPRRARSCCGSRSTDNLIDNPRWEVFPANPTADDAEPLPVQLPDPRTPARRLVLDRDEGLRRSRSRTRLRASRGTSTRGRTCRRSRRTATTTSRTRPGTGTPARSTGPSARPGSTLYPWKNVWFESKCDPTVLVPGGNDIDAAVVNLFAHAQPDARLVVLPRVHGAALERAGLQLRQPDRSRTTRSRAARRPARSPRSRVTTRT